ncbi:similar to Saccharomyces cerevisiae YKL042W SPC42 Central plaque component of spindle pole body (SPB) [Maudiozyma barnettii]|uniref:Spindle pole body component SPC42 n=1 Tax=Maudiozyma barnettii TaxID=61262 RepID=A0A8H2ZLT8_9SACH|nr:Spc42p [Kazachstania barnettii]CAB4256417.1 similar to Saccharomyces cerevisiae YKL042W SPC42 Central plaque component of spindle pole body (SPB) [Kazachstania barnettii]CAD1785026.1 similar to Saccharomyces cerevisiae YKL042W SPC42 Central plaque component of spindle pole body (SPB) [Kazachstania barnettii]
MNISPTPRRYMSRTGNVRPNAFNVDDKYYFNDPLRKGNGSSKGKLYGNSNNVNANDTFLPPEYKLSAQTFNELVELNKRLTTMLEGKQREINELKAENNEFRSKLWKYTEMADRYKNEIDRRDSEERQRTRSQNMSQPTDYIQINKRREKNTTTPYRPTNRHVGDSDNEDDEDDDDVSSFKTAKTSKEDIQHTQKLETLIKNVEHISRILSDSYEEGQTPKTRQSSSVHPTDTDILMTESSELQLLEDQIRVLQNKLNIRQQNEKRKVSLQQRLEELQNMLDSSSNDNNGGKPTSKTKKHIEHTVYESDSDDFEAIPSKTKTKIKRVDRSNIFGTPTSEI